MGDYAEARVISQAILALPTRKMIKIQTIVHDFFAGIMAFHSYREGQGDEYLETGKEVFGKMMVWSKCSADNFQNKLLLLEAEQHASLFNINAARVKFEASIRSAQDHGLIHEQGEMIYLPLVTIAQACSLTMDNTHHSQGLPVSFMANFCLA